uniref:DUF148 domain-containing protein n=1 Tax=Caenorhabditis japonica TaxID=281687 RepID=A0A8R1DVH0_CAEJA
MYLRTSILLAVCLLSVAVDSKHKHHHQKGNEPEFIKNLTNSQRSSFFGISKNPGISFQQKEDKLVKWAEENNLTEQYAEFSKNLTIHKEEVSKNVSAVIDRLAAAKTEVDKINSDKSLTKIQRELKIDELKQTYPQEVPTLFYIGHFFENPKGNETRGEKEERRGGRKNKHQ